MQTYYDILGVEQTATASDIEHAWKIKLQLLHPDRHQGSSSEVLKAAEHETFRVNEAWGMLRDQRRRAAYDATLTTSFASTRGPGPRTDTGAADCRSPHAEHAWSEPDPTTKRGPLTTVMCPKCRHLNSQVPDDAKRVECGGCGTGIRFMYCPHCFTQLNCDERWARVTCLNCRGAFVTPTAWRMPSNAPTARMLRSLTAMHPVAKGALILALMVLTTFVVFLVLSSLPEQYPNSPHGPLYEFVVSSLLVGIVSNYLFRWWRRKR